MMDEVGYDMAYIFRYSPRSGTKAAARLPGRLRAIATVVGAIILLAVILFPSLTGKERFGTDGGVAVGYLLLDSTPADARVYVDGQEIGITPHTLEIPVGRHRVTLSKPGYKRWDVSVEIKRYERTEIRAELESID
jgi:hypothetical protein